MEGVIQLARFTPLTMPIPGAGRTRRGIGLTAAADDSATGAPDASVAIPSVRKIGRAAAGSRRAPSAGAFDPAADLAGLAAEQWETIDEQMRQPLLMNLDSGYKRYLGTFYDTANLCVLRHEICLRNHRLWRYTAIIGTGLLACLNFVAAKRSIAAAAYSAIPIIAAIFAFVLALLANLEAFNDSAAKADAYRESWGLYLDAAEEYDLAWTVKVVALGDTAQAYANAVELHRRIVATDRELRRSMRELTKHGR